MIKVIIMDIDGTLANSRKEITPKTREALISAQQKGIMLVLASGRPVPGLRQFGRQLQMDRYGGLYCAYNGSMVVDCRSEEVLFNQPMSAEEARSVLHHLKNFKAVPVIDKGDYMYVNDVFNNTISYNGQPFNILQYESRGNGFRLREVKDLEEFVDFPVNKILTYADPEYLQANWQAMAQPFKGRLHSVFTAPFYYEYTALGIDKAKALDTVLKSMGFKQEEMIAFGDGQNDASIVRYAGIGVAMANAVDELKAVADEITASNEEDGIALSLQKHGLAD